MELLELLVEVLEHLFEIKTFIFHLNPCSDTFGSITHFTVCSLLLSQTDPDRNTEPFHRSADLVSAQGLRDAVAHQHAALDLHETLMAKHNGLLSDVLSSLQEVFR